MPTRRAVRPVVLAMVAMLQGLVWAQAADVAAPLRLTGTPALTEKPGNASQGLPVFLFGDRLSGRTDLESVIEGDARLRRGDTAVRAERIEYYAPDDRLRARGQVRINRAGDVFEGPELELRVESFEGSFRQPRYEFLRTGGQGEADRIDFLDDKRAVIHNASYSTCRRDGRPGWMPDWVLNASRIALDNEEETGRAEGVVVRFKDVPILPVPTLSFPLGDRRKSGWLSPSFGLDSVNGLELSLPYYWNIAPNRDATLYSTLMARRGIDLGAEFRYLESAYRGEARLNVMPSDRLRDRTRWGLTAQHSGQLTPSVGLNLRAARVSDDNYWRDFTRNGTSLTERLLPTELTLIGAVGPFSTVGRWLQWQTLQDVSAPIVPPYDRAPQLNASYVRTNLAGFDASVEMDYTRFVGDASRTGQANAQRGLVIARLSRPWVWPAGFVTPRIQLHATRYAFDRALTNGHRDASRIVPSVSLDSGLVFERNTEYGGRKLTQTLEPRAFYVHTPYRDQSFLPNYDSGALDFNLATIYSDNSYVGNDRIADNHLLTLGVTSRFLEPATGAELARFGLAQRIRLRDQRVTLPGEAVVSERLSDMLLGGSLNWNPQWLADATVQFNPKTRRSIRTTLGGRFNPGPYRTVSAAYRLQRGQSEQLDLGWQWPLNDLWGDRGLALGAGQGQGPGRWYSVGRLNYSLRDSKLVDAILGFEYDAGCWLGRVVFERLQSGVTTSSTRVLLQLELVGLSRIGSNPLRTLRENIPRYQYLREQTRPPNRFSNYD
ncbi:MAG: LPS-assembly protein LptD [Burkholderiaceae bacterium]|jgi:LPS-assembly protein|nr:LPS-assembly protein LptD [Burkholderiaceae bacterium]